MPVSSVCHGNSPFGHLVHTHTLVGPSYPKYSCFTMPIGMTNDAKLESGDYSLIQSSFFTVNSNETSQIQERRVEAMTREAEQEYQ